MIIRTVAPLSDTISKPNFPQAEKFNLNKGIELLGLSNSNQPVLMLDLVFPVGRYHEQVSGITYFVAKMLLEGTKTKSSADIANQLDFHGSHLEITPTLDYIFIKLYCLKKFFKNQVDLVFELLSDPIFPVNEFEKLRNIRIQQTKQQHVKSNAFAGLKFRETLFGSMHPYGKIISINDIKEVSLDAVIDFYANDLFSTPNLYIAGDFDQIEIDILNKKVSEITFKKNTPHLTNISSEKGGDVNVNWENSVQSSIRLGANTITKNHPDIHKLKIANKLFGGFFGSRLMKNIREEKGLTYGISSSLVHLKNESYWVVGTDVLKEKTKVAIDEIKNEIFKLKENQPSNEEVKTLKNYIKGKWLMSFDSVFNSMNMITNNHLAGLDESYWNDFMSALDETSPEEISNTTKKYLAIDSAIEVIVG